eukprot:11102949-Karenia_brevis.AAC.1
MASNASTAASEQDAESVVSEEFMQCNADEDMGTLQCYGCTQVKTKNEFTIVKKADGKRNPKQVILCKVCNAFKSRVYQLVQKRGLTSFGWSKMTSEERTEFYNKHADKSGDALETAIQECIQHITRKSSIVAMEGTGEWLDEEDLDEKYAKKPLQLAAIKKNTKR